MENFIDVADYIIKHQDDKLKELMDKTEYEKFSRGLVTGALTWQLEHEDNGPFAKAVYQALLTIMDGEEN